MQKWRDSKKGKHSELHLPIGTLSISPRWDKSVIEGYEISFGSDSFECYSVLSWDVPLAEMDELKTQALALLNEAISESLEAIHANAYYKQVSNSNGW